MTGFLLLLNSEKMPEQSGNTAVKGGRKSARNWKGGEGGVYSLQFPDDNVNTCGPLSCTEGGGDFVLWDFLGAQRLAPLRLGTEAGIHETLAYPVQAAQILHHVLVCFVVIVDDGVLFVHTAGLQQQIRDRTIS